VFFATGALVAVQIVAGTDEVLAHGWILSLQSDDIVTHDDFLSQASVTDPSYLNRSVIIDGIVSKIDAVSDI
jgi:hypothetical protein